jgi:hypothetical protein
MILNQFDNVNMRNETRDSIFLHDIILVMDWTGQIVIDSGPVRQSMSQRTELACLLISPNQFYSYVINEIDDTYYKN